MGHKIVITQEDFKQFDKVLRIIHKDISDLLSKHNCIHIEINENGSMQFNLKEVGITLNEKEKVLRAIFNFYFFCKKNSYLFKHHYLDKSIYDEKWYRDYKYFSDLLKKK